MLFCNGCNDDRLDIAPLNILTADQVFKSESAIDAFMSSLYAKMPIEDFYFYLRKPIFPIASSTDESITPGNKVSKAPVKL